LKLYITRHGQTEWNLAGKLQGWKNSPLTEEGIGNAHKLANRLKNIDFDLIYTSHQKRAIDTAKIIRGDRDTEIIRLDELKEIGFGAWEGMKIDIINEKYAEQYDKYMNQPHLYEPIDGESFQEVFERVDKALKKILSSKKDKVLIVAHGVTIKIMTAIIKNISLEDLSIIPIYPGTSLNLCEVGEDRIEFILEGDNSHLI